MSSMEPHQIELLCQELTNKTLFLSSFLSFLLTSFSSQYPQAFRYLSWYKISLIQVTQPLPCRQERCQASKIASKVMQASCRLLPPLLPTSPSSFLLPYQCSLATLHPCNSRARRMMRSEGYRVKEEELGSHMHGGSEQLSSNL